MEKQKQMMLPRSYKCTEPGSGHRRKILVFLTKKFSWGFHQVLTSFPNLHHPTITAGIFEVSAMRLYNSSGKTSLCVPHFGVQETEGMGFADRPYFLNPGIWSVRYVKEIQVLEKQWVLVMSCMPSQVYCLLYLRCFTLELLGHSYQL